jgi:hypothetical protein
LFALVVALALFAVAVDMLHIVLWSWIPRPVHTAVTLTETAGELVIVTLILLAAHRMTIRPERDLPQRGAGWARGGLAESRAGG